MTQNLDRLNALPLRDDLRGRAPYGAPQLDVAVALNTNENTHPVPADVHAAIVQEVTEAARSLNRYPDREFTALREELAAYLGHGLGPGNLWAANGSNEILQQILQAFGGPGRTLLSFVPTYSMYPLLASGTHTGFVAGERAADFGLSAESAAEQVRRHRPDVVFLCSPNNPTGTALPFEVIEAMLEAAPRALVVEHCAAPSVDGPPEARRGRSNAAAPTTIGVEKLVPDPLTYTWRRLKGS